MSAPKLDTPRKRISIGLVLISLAVGIFGGVGIFTFGYGEGSSYLRDSPASCVNCHVMQDSYDSWQHSSHHAIATCNDCHLSHHPIGKWITKADNGFFHSLAFTTDHFAEPIQIKPRNRRVTQAACIHCHGDFLHQSSVLDASVACVHCHQSVGHAHR